MCCENECDDIVLLRGIPGNGVDSTVDNDNGTFTITYTDGSTFTSADLRGADGNGILSTVDNGDGTFTFNYTNGSSFTTSNLTGPAGSFSGTVNYVSKFTGTGDTLGDSQIRDNGSNVGINRAPLTNYRVRVDTSTDLFALTGANTSITGGGHGVFGTAFGFTASTNFGVLGNASGSSVQNVGVRGEAGLSSAGKNVGLVGKAASGAFNYAVQLIDGTESIGKVLTCMTAGGDGNWATPAASGGLTWNTVTGLAPGTIVMSGNNGYILHTTTGTAATLKLPVYGGTSIGDVIEIVVAGPAVTVADWVLSGNNAGDLFYVEHSDADGIAFMATSKSGTGTYFTFDGVTISNENYKKTSMRMVCTIDKSNGYQWEVVSSTNYRIS